MVKWQRGCKIVIISFPYNMSSDLSKLSLRFIGQLKIIPILKKKKKGQGSQRLNDLTKSYRGNK